MPTQPLLVLGLLLGTSVLACNGNKHTDDSSPEDTGPIDSDGDGWDNDADCAPDDPLSHPDASEICDGLDNDCDRLIDEEAIDVVDLYLDNDGDGYGSPGATAVGCEDTPGWVVDSTDCDDTDAEVHPSADERCVTVGVDDNCNGEIDEQEAVDTFTFYADQDGDGFGNETQITTGCQPPPNATLTGSDCDDNNAQVNPESPETCTTVGIDDDCDGDTDDPDALGVLTTFADSDGDGYGDANTALLSCSEVSGYVANDQDCDDTAASVNPGSSETCSTAVDDDCDGQVNEDDSIDATTWHLDNDTDGYGDPATSSTSCDPPSGYTADNTDCNDQDSGVHPATSELCSTVGIDDNCDGLIDDATAIDSVFWSRDADGDGYANSADFTIACDQPTGYIAQGGPSDCNDDDSLVHPGASEFCSTAGVDDNCDGQTDEFTAVDAVTWFADSDNDGYGDANSSQLACTVPGAHVANSDDCDDTSASIAPGLLDEPNDNIDQDCAQGDASCTDRPSIVFEIQNLYLYPANGPYMYTASGVDVHAYGNLGHHVNGSTSSSALSENLDGIQGISGLSLDLNGFYLGSFTQHDMASGGPASNNGNNGDIRSYIAGSATIQESGIDVVSASTTTIHMGVWYPAGIGPGDADGDTFGYGISTLDAVTTDTTWYEALNTYGTGQVEYTFTSFSAVNQAPDYGVYDATIELLPYHVNCDPSLVDSDADSLIDLWDAWP